MASIFCLKFKIPSKQQALELLFFMVNVFHQTSLVVEIVLDLVDQGIYIVFERSFYGVYMPMGSYTCAVGRSYHNQQGR